MAARAATSTRNTIGHHGKAPGGTFEGSSKDSGVDQLNEWIGSLIDDFGDRILPVTTSVAERWALLNVPGPVPAIDGLIAATALAHDLVLVTRNVDDVANTGVAFVNPFAN